MNDIMTPGLPDGPTTMREEHQQNHDSSERVLSGQRIINLIWEITQGIIAIGITAAVIYSAINSIRSEELTNSFFLIVGFYFSRTNHAAIGGVGPKPQPQYEGR